MAKQFPQLQALLKIESEKEQSAAKELKEAQSYFQANQNKLEQVRSYKLDYLKKLQTMAGQGVAGGNYQHYQRFIVQLEQGIEAQLNIVDTAKQVVEQRKTSWLERKAKVKAVETLLSKKDKEYQYIADRKEQMEIDELATQKFIRGLH